MAVQYIMTAIIHNDTLLRWTCLNSYTSLRHIYYPLLSFCSLSIFFSFSPLFLLFYPLIYHLLSLPVSSLFISLLPSPILPSPCISVRLCYGPWALYYLVVVQWPLISTWRHSGISVISISVTCLSIF